MKRKKIINIAKKAEVLSPLTWVEFINGHDYWQLKKTPHIPTYRLFGMMHVLAMVGVSAPEIKTRDIIIQVDLRNIEISLYKLTYDFGNYHGVNDACLVKMFGVQSFKFAKVLISKWHEVLEFEQRLQDEIKVIY
jgi:hypothetical protein